MNYGEIKNCDIANGEGVRVTLFVSGCTNHCEECFQPQTWDFNYGELFTKEVADKIIESTIYLRANEKISMRGLLYGLLLQSGNDAAMAIACHVAGDVVSFAAMMNERAAELGMKNSHFSNPSGLNADLSTVPAATIPKVPPAKNF